MPTLELVSEYSPHRTDGKLRFEPRAQLRWHICISFLKLFISLKKKKKEKKSFALFRIKYHKSWKYFRSAKLALLTFVLPYTTQEQSPCFYAGGQHVWILLSPAFYICYAVNGVNVTMLALLALLQTKISSCWRELLQLLLQTNFNSPFLCHSLPKGHCAEI